MDMGNNKKSRPGCRAARAIAMMVAACIASGPFGAHAAESAPPLEAFGRLPTLEDVVLSPDGTKIAFVNTVGESRNLVVAPLTQPKILGGVHVGDAKLRDVEWIDDDNLLGTISSTGPPPIGFLGPKREWYQLVAFNVSKLKIDQLLFDVPNAVTFNVLSGETAVREIDGHSMLYAPGYCVRDSTVPCLFSFTFPYHSVRLIDESSIPHTDWLLDASGRIAAQFSYRDDKQQWNLRTHKDSHWVLAASGTATLDVPEMMGFNADGTAIIVRFIENGDPVWKPLNLKDNTWGPALDEGAAFSSVLENRKTGRIIGGVRGIGSNEYVFFDNELQAHWNAALRSFPDEQVSLVSHSDDYSRMVLKVFGARDGYCYAFFDWYSHHSSILGPVYEGVTSPAEVRAVSYPAADGLRIPGFLTLPHGVAAKNLPLIVLPHGGPAAADTLDFDWWAQALAAQGYAVLQPNFRGSILDSKFAEAGYGEWGRKMQSDLSDGVRFLAHQGTIDPQRVCIVGASYGGYAALAGVTVESGVYRCAVSVAGISDLRRFRKWLTAGYLSLT
jgi:hypothetical protein